MKFKKLSSVFLIMAVTASMAGCSKNTDAENEKTTLRVGVMSSIDALPFVIAKENGYYKDEGITLNLQIFNSAGNRDAALQAGTLDGVLCDEVAISIYKNSGIDMKITGTTTGSWTLVAGKDSGITQIKDIAKKKVGISQNTMIDYLADYIVTANGMKADDINKIAIPAMPARMEALKNNQIDAAILPAPFNDNAIAAGGKSVVKISNDDIMLSVTAFSEDAITNKADKIKSFYKAYNKAVDYINNTDISKYEDLVIKTVGYSEDMKGNIKLPKFKKNYLPASENVQNVINWSKGRGLLTKDVKAGDLMSDVGIK